MNKGKANTNTRFQGREDTDELEWLEVNLKAMVGELDVMRRKNILLKAMVDKEKRENLPVGHFSSWSPRVC